VKKICALRLHIVGRVVELFDPTASPGNTGFSERERQAMKRLLILTALALVTATSGGCWHWFNRGAQCNPCAPATTGYADPCMSAPGVGDPTMLPSPVIQTGPAQ
jgi:hypothetical protein